MTRRTSVTIKLAVAAVFAPAAISLVHPAASLAAIVSGGGSSATDCVLVLDIPDANSPAQSTRPRNVDCIDGDKDCDDDKTRNGECVFSVRVCVNSTEFENCDPVAVDNVAVDHSDDGGDDPRFDVDFQAIQFRAEAMVPTGTPDRCATAASSITVPLLGPDSSNVMRRNRKSLRITTYGSVAGGDVRDVDKVKFTCRPEGDAVYLPRDLYSGTFDRISKQIFATTCAVASCHDSESHQNHLVLLPGQAYGNLVNFVPDNDAAEAAGLMRVTPGDPDMSFLYRKLTGDLEPGWDARMPYLQGPLDESLVELIRLWIVGDTTLGAAPQDGWVEGTDN